MQPRKKLSPTITLSFLALAVVAAYMIATPPQSHTGSGRHSSVRPTLPGGAAGDQFTEEDTHAHFVKLGTTPPDVFKPIIYRATGAAGGVSNAINAIPPEDANNEAGWTFTGIVAIDNASQASFENDKSGEFAQVGAGQHWKTSTVSRIGPDSVTLVGPNGDKTIPLPTEAPKAAAVASTASADNNAPVMPPITGAIGAQSQDATATNGADNAQIQFQGGGMVGGVGGRGRGGRGRGGRGGGPGGGGGGNFGFGGPGGG